MSHWRIRTATIDDRAAIEAVIAQSARGLGRDDYSGEQIEGALQSAFGLDSQLIADQTFYVVSGDSGTLVGCGGWSRRRTLFGSDSHAARDAGELDPACDAARIRAFFVHPHHARQGIGKALLECCEAAARAAGFRRAELMATLTGMRLYEKSGYLPGAAIEHRLAGDLTIRFVPMSRDLTG